MKKRHMWVFGTLFLLLALAAASCGSDGGGDDELASGALVWTRGSDPSTEEDIATAMAMDSYYLYVVGNSTTASGDRQWRIEKRRRSDGGLVSGFGQDGVVVSNPSGNNDEAWAIAIDASYMYIAGDDGSPAPPPSPPDPPVFDRQWRIEKRSLADGSLDTDFGVNGVVTSDLSAYYDLVTGLAVDGTSLYVVGLDESPGMANSQWRIEKRSLVNGSPDADFGPNNDGIIAADLSAGSDAARAIAIAGSYLYVVGIDSVPGNPRWRIEKRSLADGAGDTAFGPSFDGVVTSEFNSSLGVTEAITIHGEYMYVGGYDRVPGIEQWRIEKRNLSDGELVSGFGPNQDGVVTSGPDDSSNILNALTNDGTYLYVTGFDSITATSDEQWRIEKRSMADGGLDTAFGTGGIILSNPSDGFDRARAIMVNNSRIYVAGNDSVPGYPNSRWRIEKRVK